MKIQSILHGIVSKTYNAFQQATVEYPCQQGKDISSESLTIPLTNDLKPGQPLTIVVIQPEDPTDLELSALLGISLNPHS